VLGERSLSRPQSPTQSSDVVVGPRQPHQAVVVSTDPSGKITCKVSLEEYRKNLLQQGSAEGSEAIETHAVVGGSSEHVEQQCQQQHSVTGTLTPSHVGEKVPAAGVEDDDSDVAEVSQSDSGSPGPRTSTLIEEHRTPKQV
jgi:hypothetical protein